jgi:hypothetical protein
MKGYFDRGDRINDAIDSLVSVKSSFVGDTLQARALILALCDQTGASIEAQRAVAALLYMSEEALPPVLKKKEAMR